MLCAMIHQGRIGVVAPDSFCESIQGVSRRVDAILTPVIGEDVIAMNSGDRHVVKASERTSSGLLQRADNRSVKVGIGMLPRIIRLAPTRQG